MDQKTCTECGGARPPRRGGRGLCGACYQRRWKTGECAPTPPLTVEQRIDAKIEKAADTCWLWTGTQNGVGYGSVSVGGRSTLVHRLQYERYVGPIPAGLQLDHLCRVRRCVNPDHLEAVTPRENILRSPVAPASVNAAKTHCPAGHAYSSENTYYRTPTDRRCRECDRQRARRRYAAQKADLAAVAS